MMSSSVLVMLALAATAMGCKRPTDYKTKPIPEVLDMSDLTIVGTMTGYDVIQQPNDNIHVKYNTQIKCVLKNTKKISLSSSINITSIQYREFGNANTCEMAYINDIVYNQEQVIMIRPFAGMPGEFFFDFVNFQGPFFGVGVIGVQVQEDCEEAHSISSLEPVLMDDTSGAGAGTSSISTAIFFVALSYILISN